jgi:hypothetical protein
MRSWRSHLASCTIQIERPSLRCLCAERQRLFPSRDAMDHHFASSWLKSLSNKLESLAEWSWVAERCLVEAVKANLGLPSLKWQLEHQSQC